MTNKVIRGMQEIVKSTLKVLPLEVSTAELETEDKELDEVLHENQITSGSHGTESCHSDPEDK